MGFSEEYLFIFFTKVLNINASSSLWNKHQNKELELIRKIIDAKTINIVTQSDTIINELPDNLVQASQKKPKVVRLLSEHHSLIIRAHHRRHLVFKFHPFDRGHSGATNFYSKQYSILSPNGDRNPSVLVLEGNIKVHDKNGNDKILRKFQLIDMTCLKQKQLNVSRRAQKIPIKLQATSSRSSRILNQQQQLSKISQFDASYLLFDQKQIDSLKHELIKADRTVKADFLVKNLFGGYNPIFSHNLIQVQRLQAKSKFELKCPIEKVSLLYSGIVILKTLSQDSALETQLLSGAMLSDSLLQQINGKENIKPRKPKTQIFCSTDCTILSLDIQQFRKIIKNEIAIKNSIKAKKRQIQSNRLRQMKSNKFARDHMKETQQNKPILSYPIKMKKKRSKIFRLKAQQLYDIQNYMSMDFYRKMIRNKETVVFKKDQFELKNIIDFQCQNPIKEQSVQKDKFEEDVTLKGFFEVGNKIKTQKLSTSIFRKQMPSLSRKPEVYIAPKKKQSQRVSVLRKLIPKSAKRSHQLYRQYSQFESRVRNSETNTVTKAVTMNASPGTLEVARQDCFNINSIAFDPQERFSVVNAQGWTTGKENKRYTSRKHKAQTFSSSKQTSKTNASSQYKFVIVNTKNIINSLISDVSTPNHTLPFTTSKYIPPRSAPLKKKNRTQINHTQVR